jgi:hypothetical protein
MRTCLLQPADVAHGVLNVCLAMDDVHVTSPGGEDVPMTMPVDVKNHRIRVFPLPFTIFTHLSSEKSLFRPHIFSFPLIINPPTVYVLPFIIFAPLFRRRNNLAPLSPPVIPICNSHRAVNSLFTPHPSS